MGMLAYWHSGRWPPIAIERGTSRLIRRVLYRSPVTGTMGHANTTDIPAFLAPSLALAIDRHASMPACHNRNAGMLGCTQAAQTDQHFLPPPLLAGHRPALQEGAKNSGVSVLLACTLAYQHPSCWHAGMLACWLMASQRGRGARMLVYLCYWGAPQHASIPSCWHVGMLACWSMVSQRGRGRKMLSVLLACTPACQHPQLLACWHAGMQTSSTDRPA